MTSTPLRVRNTRAYVGTYQHLDDWTDIGRFIQTASGDVLQPGDADDICEPHTLVLTGLVELDQPVDDETVAQALRDTFTSEGCGHEYDCCGCRSFRVGDVKRCSEELPLWTLLVHSSRNY